jgi:hypothetical protein
MSKKNVQMQTAALLRLDNGTDALCSSRQHYRFNVDESKIAKS